MKKIFYFIFFSIIILAVNACKDKIKNGQFTINEFQSSLTINDTIEMLDKCNACMEQLKAHDFEGVLNVLYEYDSENNLVSPLSDTSREKYSRMFNMFPVYDYQLNYYSFHEEGCNDVKYDVIFGEAINDSAAPRTSFMFNPVRIGGQWFVTVKTADQRFDTLLQ